MTNESRPTSAPAVSPNVLRRLEPICALSALRLSELAGMCSTEAVNRGLDPFRLRSIQGQSVYLLILLCPRRGV